MDECVRTDGTGATLDRRPPLHPPRSCRPSDEDVQQLSWAVAISDDYDDAEPRVVLTVEEVGRAGAGLIAHLPPGSPAACGWPSGTPSGRSARTPGLSLSGCTPVVGRLRSR